MREKLERIPFAMSGVMLAYATLGFLLRDMGGTVYHACSIIAGVLFVVLAVRIVVCLPYVKEEMLDPVKCSVSATFSMGMILLTDYARPVLGKADTIIWIAAVALHVYLMIFFNGHNLYQFKIENVYATYFIFYAGLSTVADTAPIFGMRGVGVWFSKVSMILVLILFFVITYRYIKFPKIENRNKALICTYASPVSLLIVGYLACETSPLLPLVTVLAFVSIAAYLFAAYHGVRVLAGTFYPSFAALTFPFVVSALAMKRVSEYAASMGGVSFLGWTSYVYPAQVVIAVILMVYITLRFVLSYVNNDPNM
ncbi:MAG: TDT family transporter [Anaerostipes sp.]|nr:TDT family transporter [Anaerostipes sp.]